MPNLRDPCDGWKTFRIAPGFIAAGIILLIGPMLPAAKARNGPPVSAGLNGIADWSRTHEFADLVKQSRPFGSSNTPWDGLAPKDARGWPTGDAGVVLLCCQPTGAGFPDLSGVYRIRFECAATPVVSAVASPGTVRNIARNAATGIVTAEYVQPPGGDTIMLRFTGTNGGIRNLSVMRPGTSGGQTFMPAFLAHNQRFGVLRFMDWTLTNNNETVTWADRTLPEDATWNWRSGVPYEACVDAVNATSADMWINVPAKANDDYVRRMARLIRDRLSPGRNVYVEYSNEVWNWQFNQAQYNLQQAVAEAAAGGSNLAHDGATDQNVLRWRRHARETVRVGRIFAEEFGPGSLNTRVRPVLAGQIVWSDQYKVSLDFISSVIGPPKNHVYCVAGAPYFNVADADTQTNLTTTQVLASLSRSIDQTNGSIMYERLAAYSAAWGLRPFMAYEGGVDTFGPNNVAAKRAANHDPAMRELCARYLRGWFAAGGGNFNWFVSGAGDWNSQYGTWTLTESMTNQVTPKILALDDVRNAATPAITIGAGLPGVLDARRHIERRDNWLTTTSSGIRNVGESLDYLVRTPVAGGYKLRLNAAAWSASAGVGIGVNRVQQRTLTLPRTGAGANTNFQWSGYSGNINLPGGLSVLRLTWLDGYAHDMLQIELASVCVSLADVAGGVGGGADGVVDGSDFVAFLNSFGVGDPAASPTADVAGAGADGLIPDGVVDGSDFIAFINAFSQGC